MARRAGYDACSWRAQSSSDPGQDRALASNLEEPRPVGKLLPAWRSRSLHRQVRPLLQPPTLSREPEKSHAGRFYFGRGQTILMKRERIKRDTIQNTLAALKESRLT